MGSVSFGVNLITGDSFVFLKTSQPTSSLPFYGHRIRSGAAAAGASAPGAKAAFVGTDEQDAARAVAGVYNPAALEKIRVLYEALKPQ